MRLKSDVVRPMGFSVKRTVIRFIMEGVLGRLMQDVNTWLYRISGGKVGAHLLGAPILLLTTVGRKSGLPRTVPLVYFDGGEVLVIVASKGGAPQHPLWYRNLVATPQVQVEVRGKRKEMVAATATPEQRKVYWPRVVDVWADYEKYQSWTDREIPLVLLTESAQGSATASA